MTIDNKPAETQEVQTDPTSSENNSSQGRGNKILFFGAIGIVFVLIVLFYFIFQLNKPADLALRSSENSQQINQPLTIALESPTDTQVVEDGKLLVKGRTLPNTTVLIYSDEDQASAESDSNGYFEGFVKLINGINTLNVTAYADSGEEKSLTLDIVYDEEASAGI